MEQPTKTFRLRGISGEYARKWLAAAGGLAKEKGTDAPPLAYDDAKDHPENYFVSRGFTDDEDSAWQVPTFEMAKSQQLILEREGIETQIV
jgi:hypothetical protein